MMPGHGRQTVLIVEDVAPLRDSYWAALQEAGHRGVAAANGNTILDLMYAENVSVILLDLFNSVEPSPPQIRLTALAASAAGDPGDAYYYMAQYDLAGGNLPLANQQLELALAAPNLSAIQRARFRAQLDEVRGWLREQQAAHRR